jgi:hypothetical protein
MTLSGCRGSHTGCLEDYLEFREGIEALRAEAKMRERLKNEPKSLSEELLKDSENQD